MMGMFMPSVFAATLASPLTATMTSHDAAVWKQSDGWSNGAPFQVGWRADHLTFANGFMNITLDNQPTCSLLSPNCSNEPFASGEYQSIALISYGRLTFRAKAIAASGVITGLFTYTGAADGQPHDEIDIEFLGKDTTQVQFNYYTAGVGGHEVLLPLGFDASTGFHDYTIEWLPSAINWYVDGVLKHSVNAGAGVTLPSFAQHIVLNAWAATGVNAWSGAFNYMGVPLTAQVDQVTYIPALGSGAAVGTGGGGCVLQTGLGASNDMTLLIFLLLLMTLRQLRVAKDCNK